MEDFVPFFTFQGHSVFVPLKYVYPECFVLIDPHVQLSPMQCLRTSCPANANCATKLAKRVNFLFNHVVPEGKMIYAYFKYRDRPNSIRAAVFDREMDEPKVMVLNQSAFRKFMKEGIQQKWYPPVDYWLAGGSDKLISVEHLLVKK